MGGDSSRKRSRKRKGSDTTGSSDCESEYEEKRLKRHRSRKERRDREKSRKEYRKEKREKRIERERRSTAYSDENSGEDRSKPRAVVRYILKQFPSAGDELKQLLQMIDSGQAIDTREIADKLLVKLLKKLFLSFNLKENETGVFSLRKTAIPTLEVVGSLLCGKPNKSSITPPGPETKATTSDLESQNANIAQIGPLEKPDAEDDPSISRRRRIGPEMPSAELLALAAKLTEAEAELRDANLEVDNDLFIGPPPPAVVAEAESANEAERFEEVTRIVGAEIGNPYDILGVNRNMPTDNIKKKYWKLSLMVHPDKCSHPQAKQAFVTLNQAFKELQDPEKRKAIDDNMRQREEKEEFKAELKACREAALWRQSQGISMKGDEELLEQTKSPPKREEWMTTLPPERKPGMTMQSTSFSKTTKEGRGDTSIWTDTPSDKAQKAKTNYLEAYNRALEVADKEGNVKSSDAELVDSYNRSKRSIPLVQKHIEEQSNTKKKKKKSVETEKEDWVGKHPWKPWDRDRDLSAGRQKVNFDPESIGEGLASRFSSASFQRNFL